MKLAFALFKYFPYGGLERDFLRIAKECQSRGHEIFVYSFRLGGRFDYHKRFFRFCFCHNIFTYKYLVPGFTRGLPSQTGQNFSSPNHSSAI